MPTRAASGSEPEVEQPGLRELREAVVNYAGEQLPRRASLRRDAIAGVNGAIMSVPEGMASGLLAGVNPIYGLYACIAGPVVGAIFSSTKLMVITTTSVAALGAGQALGSIPLEVRADALFVLVLLIGAFQVVFGLLGMGQLTRFISYSVMTGFIFGIAVLTILSQLPTVTGYEPIGASRIAQTLDLLANLGQINPLSLAIAVLAMALAMALPRTRLGNFGRLLAIAIPSAAVALANLESVQVVQDVGTIPSGIPIPALPSFAGLTFDLITGALAVATIILVQGAGVSQSVPNPDGSHRSTSRDFIAQGAANVASGLYRGLPVGGSLGSTSLNVIAGARTRWSAIFTGLCMASIVLVFPGLISYVAMPALGALLIVASASVVKPAEGISIWLTGWPSRLASISTFLAMLILPIQAAVGLGVVLSAAIHLFESSTDVTVVELVERPDGRIEERRAPKQLRAGKVSVLDVYGYLFFAGARSLARLLPKAQDVKNPVVILRLRGRTIIGATLIEVLSHYAEQIQEAGGRLYLSGISKEVHDEIVRTGKLYLHGPVRVYEATPILGQSTRRALTDAQAWLIGRSDEGLPDV